MQPIIYLYCICYLSPYMFRALTGPSSELSWAACLCYHLVHAVLLSVRASSDSNLVVRQDHRPRTHGETTALLESNGGINKQRKTPLMMGQ
jgi:hypothetical protein